MSTNQLPKRIYLHFDVNKTIIFVDPAGGKSVEDMVNSSLASCAFGKLTKVESQGEQPKYSWKIVSKEPTIVAPEKGLVSFADFIEIYAHPDPKHSDTVPVQERAKINKEHKKLRDQAKGSFTSKGKLGEDFGIWREKFLKRLELKKPTEKQKHVFLLPCFFNLFIELKKRNWDNYTIIIRTFGTDIKEVQEEFNEFCEGKHHDYPNVLFNGKNGSRDLRITSENTGNFFRNGKTEKDIYLVKGTIEQMDTMEGVNKDKLLVFHKNCEIIQGYKDIYKYLMSRKDTLAIRDFYPWWNANNRHPSAGKLFLIDPEDKDILQVFFDDNVIMEKSDLGIIDVRNINGNNIDFLTRLDHNLVMVQPLESVFRENYFMERLEKCIENWRKTQKVVEQVIQEEVKYVPVTKEECIKFLDQLFKEVDRNKDGVLTKSEVHEALMTIEFPLKHEVVTKVIEECDKNGDGKLDPQEFREGILKLAK